MKSDSNIAGEVGVDVAVGSTRAKGFEVGGSETVVFFLVSGETWKPSATWEVQVLWTCVSLISPS